MSRNQPAITSVLSKVDALAKVSGVGLVDELMRLQEVVRSDQITDLLPRSMPSRDEVDTLIAAHSLGVCIKMGHHPRAAAVLCGVIITIEAMITSDPPCRAGGGGGRKIG